MSRGFFFNIPKPVDTTGTYVKRLHDDLKARFPQGSLSSSDPNWYTNIIGFLFPSGATQKEVTFDKGFSREAEERILMTDFGDGYQQRIKDGINTKRETYSMTINNRKWQEIALISSFFDTKTPQSFEITLQRESIKVVCESYSVQMDQPDIHSISTELRRVYEL